MTSALISCPSPREVLVRSFGTFSVALASRPRPAMACAQPLLLKVLIARKGGPVSVASVARELWHGREASASRSAFDTAVYRLRRFLGDVSLVPISSGAIQLHRERVWADAWALETLASQIAAEGTRTGNVSRLVAELLELYQGPFCEDENTPSIIHARSRLRLSFVNGAIRAAAWLRRNGELDEATDLLEAALCREETSEPLHRALIELWLERGYRSEAAGALDRCRRVLRARLGVDPCEPTSALIDGSLRA